MKNNSEENYMDKYMEEFKKFKKSIKFDCIRAERDLSNKLNMKIEVYPSCSISEQFIRTVEVRVVENATDYKSVTVGYGDITFNMEESAMTFEESVLYCFVMNMLAHPECVTTYKASYWEKSLEVFITHLAADCNISGYYIHPDQILMFTGSNKVDKEVVYLEEVSGIQYITDEVAYIFVSDELNPDNKDIDYIVLRPEGFEIKKKLNKEVR